MSRPTGGRPRVVLTRRWPDQVEKVLADRFDVRTNETDVPFTAGQLARALREADALCPTVTDRIGADLLSVPDVRVRLIANFGVGFNHIDVEAAAAAGIAVTNTPGVLTDCTADLAMTLLLMTARRAGEGERELRSGAWRGWRPTHLPGTRVSGRTLGIVGAGRIGLATAARARHGFGMKILLHSRSAVPEQVLAGLDAEQCTLSSLLPRADFVSLHCPYTADTRHLIGPEALAAMKPGAILINTARGGVVDEAALAAALREGRIGGAGLDVYEQEPAVPEALMELPNVVLLPHLGSNSRETRVAMGLSAVESLTAFFDGQPLRHRVDGA